MAMKAEDLKPGERLGRYLLGPELGRGAMGMVFLAEDTLLKQRLCVKVLHPALSSHPEAAERFNREIVLARRIVHKNVCRLHDIHEENGLRFITMEFVEGVPLRDLLTSDAPPLPVARALAIGRNICEALAAAHDVGVVHRDLKPRNIMVRDDDEVTLLDFGIARALDNQSSLTLPGVALGTRHYIAPEVWAGKPATPKSDQFSVGVVLFNCLTGKMPFSAQKDVMLLEAMSKGPPPPPSQVRGDAPSALDAVVLRALAFRPEDRYPDVRALARALRDSDTTLPSALPLLDVPLPLARPAAADPPPTLPGKTVPLSVSTDEDGPPMTLGDVTLVSVPPTDPTVVRPAAVVSTDPPRQPLTDASWVVDGKPVELPAIPRPDPAAGNAEPRVRLVDEDALTVPGGSAFRRVAAGAAAAVAVAALATLAFALRPRDTKVALPDAGAAAAPEPADPPEPPDRPEPPATATTTVTPVPEPTPPDAHPAPRPAARTASRPGPRADTRADQRRFNDERAALDRLMHDKGLLPGDDGDLDRLRQKAALDARARHFSDAGDLALEARRRADAVLVDQGFVKRKLIRFNARYDAIGADGVARTRLDAMSSQVLKQMKDGRYDEANKTLNEAFAALARIHP